MPKGVAKDFLRILDADVRDHGVRTLVFGILGLLLFLPAWLMADLLGVAVHAGSLAVGAVVGVVVGHRRTAHLEGHMRTGWTDWMRYSLACETVGELDRRVRGRSQRARTYLAAAGLLVLWAAEVVVLSLALAADAPASWAIVAVAANGVLAGLLVGSSIRLRSWTAAFRGSIDDMVDEGEIGVWGVR